MKYGLGFWDVFPLIACTIAFIFGVVKLFKKKTPMYFQLAICSVGCFALEKLYDTLCYLCTGGFVEGFSIGTLGCAGSIAFLLVANTGAFDSIFNDVSEGNKKERLMAWIAPAILTLIIIFVLLFAELKAQDIIVTAIIFAAAVPCSYFNLKLVLLKDKNDGFLKAVKPLNLVSLIYCVLTILMLAFSAFEKDNAVVALCALMGVVAVALAVSADWGRKQWAIQ